MHIIKHCYFNRLIGLVGRVFAKSPGDQRSIPKTKKMVLDISLLRYWSYGSQIWSLKWNAVSSKQWLCRYCYMDALNGWRKSLTSSTLECCEQYWTSPGINTPKSSSCTATYHPSRKLSKLDEPDTRYCWRSRDELMSDVLLWTPSPWCSSHWKESLGSPSTRVTNFT